jgi:hypothetical protein
MTFRRHATLTVHARRLTPTEVARDWFRRGADFAKEIHTTYPDFPSAASDGLYMISQVELWFERFHGIKSISFEPTANEQAEAMRAAHGQR